MRVSHELTIRQVFEYTTTSPYAFYKKKKTRFLHTHMNVYLCFVERVSICVKTQIIKQHVASSCEQFLHIFQYWSKAMAMFFVHQVVKFF